MTSEQEVAAEKQTGTEAVMRMRNEFVQLAQCYLVMGDFGAAREATNMAEALTKFEAQHNMTAIEWPPVAEQDEYDRGFLKGDPDTVYER